MTDVPHHESVLAERFGRNVMLLQLPTACNVASIGSALIAALADFVAAPGAVVLDVSRVKAIDEDWARELTELIADFPADLGRATALVRPADRTAASQLADVIDGSVPVFTTRAGALLRAVVAGGTNGR